MARARRAVATCQLQRQLWKADCWGYLYSARRAAASAKGSFRKPAVGARLDGLSNAEYHERRLTGRARLARLGQPAYAVRNAADADEVNAKVPPNKGRLANVPSLYCRGLYRMAFAVGPVCVGFAYGWGYQRMNG